MQSFPLTPENGSELEVTHVFSSLPPTGYTALRVTLTNKGKQALTASLEVSAMAPGGRSTHVMSGGRLELTVKAESSSTQEWTVPLMTNFSDGRGYRSYEECSLNVTGTAGGRVISASFRNRTMNDRPFAAVSQSLGGREATFLNDEARKAVASSGYSRDDNAFSSFLPEHLPSDWKAYTGLDVIALNADEWNTLAPGVRTAIRQWALLGGALQVYHSGPEPAAILTELKAGPGAAARYPLGSGNVRTYSWDGKVLPASAENRFEDKLERIGDRRQTAAKVMREDNAKTPGPGLVESIGVRSFAAWQVGIILVIFGVLVGPVNLFYLAGPGRRHRLFVTTPLIALGASVVLVMVIFLQDGSGGSGQRAAMVELRPDDNLAVVRQFQISRTGVLFGGGFTLTEPAVITPLLLNNSRWTRLKPPEANDSEGQRYSLPEPNVFGGDWFQSRSEQAQLIESLRPGRGRLELKPGGGNPIVVSSFPAAVDQLFYQDPAGQWWRAGAALTTGASGGLQQATEAEFEEWLKNALVPFGPVDRQKIQDDDHRGKFYGTATNAQAGLLDTLKSISWQNDFVFLHGRLAPAPAPVP